MQTFYNVVTTTEFTDWVSTLKDHRVRKAILQRLTRVATGNFGDAKSVGQGVSELRIRLGKGNRLYYTIKDQDVIIMLCGGDKTTQTKDIERAKILRANL